MLSPESPSSSVPEGPYLLLTCVWYGKASWLFSQGPTGKLLCTKLLSRSVMISKAEGQNLELNTIEIWTPNVLLYS